MTCSVIFHRYQLRKQPTDETNMEASMKKLLTLYILVLFTFGCSSDNAKSEVKLESMMCGMCSATIEDEISKLNGVVTVEIDDDKKTGVFTYKASVIDLATIETAISKLGYSANDTKANPDAYEALAPCCQIGT